MPAQEEAGSASPDTYLFFFPWWLSIVVRSVAVVPGFRGISSLAALPPVFHDPAPQALPLSIDSLATKGKKMLDETGERTP